MALANQLTPGAQATITTQDDLAKSNNLLKQITMMQNNGMIQPQSRGPSGNLMAIQ